MLLNMLAKYALKYAGCFAPALNAQFCCRDINPQAPVHFLVIPKDRDGLTQLAKCTDRHESLLGHLIHVASKVALQGDSLQCLLH